ncbi:MAG: hypothetical protein Q4B73_00480 [Lachnospiraceae bacterium]|nr:hypothetical protein [Lachnospiraceae bacterium]
MNENFYQNTQNEPGGPNEPDKFNQPPQPKRLTASEGLALVSVMFGVFSLIFMFFGGSFFFGAMGVIAALLSRRRLMATSAKIGLILSSIGLALSVAFMTFATWVLLSTGTWQKIQTDLDQIDYTSANAASDVMTIVQDDVYAMMEDMMAQLSGGAS